MPCNTVCRTASVASALSSSLSGMPPRYAAVALIVAQVRMHLLVVAVALICLGLITGCERTTGGTVAMTTEPGPATTTRSTTTTSRPTTSVPTRTSPTSEVPAPPNASTMTCSEYSDLDEATQLAVLRAILADENTMFT